jgi:phosphatidylglycerophosphate synthase
MKAATGQATRRFERPVPTAPSCYVPAGIEGETRMSGSDPQPLAAMVERKPPLVSFFRVAALLAVAVSIAASVTMQAIWGSVFAFGVMAILVARGLATHYPHGELGLCNIVTLIRAALVSFLFGAVLASDVSHWVVLGVAAVALALDGVDGWLARRSGLSSDFGARFDMETDAALAAVLALWLLVSGTTGLEVLLLGFTRYVFVIAAQAVPALRAELPDSFRRKAVCVVQIGTLLVLVSQMAPAAAVVPITLLGAALLTWSFAIDVVWLLRHAGAPDASATHGRMGAGASFSPPERHRVLRLGAAMGVLYLLLVAPNHPGDLSWTLFTRFPLELVVVTLALLAVGGGSWARVVRVLIVAGLMTLVVLKAADFAMYSALSRSFNPVADLALIDAGIRLLTGAVGSVFAVLSIAAALVAVAAVAMALWWATGVLAQAAPDRTGARRAMAGASVLAAALVAVQVADALRLWQAPIVPPGSAVTTRVGVHKAREAVATLADLTAFKAAAASDPLAGRDGLLDRIDRDVIVVFVESYGRASLDTPLYADLHRATLEAGEQALAELGLATASGFLASPTRGGQSWLAHASFANGLWVDGQTRYRAVLASGRQTLFHVASRAGFHTAAVMPQITMHWPESTTMGFDTVLAAQDLGYEGLSFNWVTMPDQFTFAALDRLLRDPQSDRPVFVQVATGSSHAPWVPVPELVPWEAVGDGRVFNEMAQSGDTPKIVWADRDRVRAQYRLAVDYALQTVLSYAARHAGDPPLMIVVGDHQAAGFVALDDRPDVPIHVIGPAHLVALAETWGLSDGLVPPPDAPVLKMDRMRDLILGAFSSDPQTTIARQ